MHPNSIDSIYLPWLKDLKATLLANYPLPESVSPIPDDIQLPPKYSLRLLPSITMNSIHDGNTDPSSLTDDERRFLAIRTKSAARSHILHPMPAAEQAAQDLERLRAMFPAHYARADAGWERENGPVDRLDKDNILKDQPEMYLLERETTQTSDCPPLEVLPIPDTLLGKLLQNRRVTPAEHWQDVRYLSFEIILGPKELDIAFQLSGNLTLTIFPKNYPQDVEEIIRLMDWDAVADRLFSVDHGPRGLYVEDRVTSIRELLTHHLDFTAIPKRSFIKELAYYTNEEREIERLRELTMPGNEQEFYDYTSRPRRTILEVLRDFPGVKIPHERILDIFPLIRGREYSVCNGGIDIKATENEGTFRVDILAALVEYKTIIRKPRQGLCSRYLKHLPTGAMLRVGLKLSSGQSLVPDKSAASRPMVAIATGTGIAPIRAIIQEREIYGCQGDTLLFFGCRNRSADFYFEHEWENYPSVKVYPAFSRDNIVPDPATTALRTNTEADAANASAGAGNRVGMSGVPAPQIDYDAGKNYVQHLIRKHADEVGALMRRYPIVCICGNNGRMPISVRRALLDALVISGVVADTESAERWFGNPQNLTFWQETW